MPDDDTRAAALQHALARRLKLRQFALLMALEQHRTVSRVAKELGVTQPAVTKALREVEDIVSIALFERTASGLVATAIGKSVLDLARRWFADIEATSRVITSIEAGRAGRLRLGMAYAMPQVLISAAFRELLGRTPKVSVVTREGTTDQLVAALLARELDCALGRSFDGDATGLVQQALYAQEACFVMGAKSASRIARRPIDLASLSALDWILPPANTPVRRIYNAVFIAAGLQPPNPILETLYSRSVEVALRVEPNAIAIITKDAVADFVEAGHCAVLPYRLGLDLPPVSFFTTPQLEKNPIVSSLRTALAKSGRSLRENRDRRPSRE